MSLVVKRDDEGSIVSVQRQNLAHDQTRITAYLLDASALKVPLSDLTLEWEEQSEGTVAKIRLREVTIWKTGPSLSRQPFS